MLALLFLLSTWSVMCLCQVVYMPRYVVRPVRRSAMEALERLRLPPLAHYFPQVDTPPVNPYMGGSPYVAGYPIGDVYNQPGHQWDDYGQQVPPPAEEEEGDYGNYEYPAPVYRTQFGEVYAQEPSDTYNKLMDTYLMEPKEDMFDVQRRRINEKENSTTTASPPSTQQVQMTAVPSAPEKKDIKSLVVPDQRVEERDDEGQKEEPLFRPLQSSQRTMWKPQKTPIPLLKKIIQQNGQQKRNDDPLLDELTNLKRKNPVF